MHSSQAPILILFGPPAAGKTTLGDALAVRLREAGGAVVRLDGDILRAGLNRDLGFSHQDRAENHRRAFEVAALLARQGITVVASLIAPTGAIRAQVGEILVGLDPRWIWVDASLEARQARDPRGLYAQAARGEITGLTGYDAPFEEPEAGTLRIRTDESDLVACLAAILG